jgi:hypothetical protein
VEQAPDGKGWRLLHPRCALERSEDLEEVDAILEAGENEIGMDELRWLLGGCPDFIAAHRRLADLALAAGDLPLARGHYGHAFRVGLAAMAEAGNPQPLNADLPENEDFFQCGQGLAHCLRLLDKGSMAREVVQQMVACDPRDSGRFDARGCG